MPDQKPQKGDWASARKVVHDDGRDVDREEGVVVDVPKDKRGYYRLVQPGRLDRPIRGHMDDAKVVPDGRLLPSQKEFREEVKDLLGDNS